MDTTLYGPYLPNRGYARSPPAGDPATDSVNGTAGPDVCPIGPKDLYLRYTRSRPRTLGSCSLRRMPGMSIALPAWRDARPATRRDARLAARRDAGWRRGGMPV